MDVHTYIPAATMSVRVLVSVAVRQLQKGQRETQLSHLPRSHLSHPANSGARKQG